MLLLTDNDLDRLLRQSSRYDGRAYSFVIEALNEVLTSLPERRHISAAELSDGVRTLALEKYGILARNVLEHWGIFETDDVGRIVFLMVDLDILVMEDDDRPEDFCNTFDFEEAFERDYPWKARH